MYSLDDYDFELPPERIATRPLRPRRASRLLVNKNGLIHDGAFENLTDFLQKGDLLVMNNTKVLRARLIGSRSRDSAQGRVQAKIEVMLDRPAPDGTWHALIKPLKKVNIDEVIAFRGGLCATLVDKSHGQGRIAFECDPAALEQHLEVAGDVPLPPYITAQRAADKHDIEDYQTVFAQAPGAVAAPTASLHFDEVLLDRLAARGVERAEVTLHVGAGTFLPVKEGDIRSHHMHPEWGEVSAHAAAQIQTAKDSGRRVIAVGTTALRILEAASKTGKLAPWSGETDIYIYPGFEFSITDGLITNFHLPKSSLLLLVAAFVGFDQMKSIYTHALANNYRFFSYGDGSLLIRS